MSLFVERKIATELGELALVITCIDHISLQGRDIEVRGIRYNIHLHYHKIGSAWGFRNERDGISITGSYNNTKNTHWGKAPAPTIAAKIVGICNVAVAKFAAENRDVFFEAEDIRLTNEVASKVAEVNEKEAALGNLRAELIAAQRDLEAIKQARLQPAPPESIVVPTPDAPKAPKAIGIPCAPDTEVDVEIAIREIRQALATRSGKQWSVTNSRGTSYGWIKISAPPARRVENYYMSDADQMELQALLGLISPIGRQSVSIPSTYNHYREYICRARGHTPTVYGKADWD